MNTTHDDNATTWRDLAVQLTPAQVEQSTTFERDALGDPAEIAECLLEMAREHARQNLNDRLMFGHLPVPPDATRLWHWEQADDGTWSREFVGTARTFKAFDVTISGIQHVDGSVTRYADVYGNDGMHAPHFGADELRAAAANLLEAADELDALQ